MIQNSSRWMDCVKATWSVQKQHNVTNDSLLVRRWTDNLSSFNNSLALTASKNCWQNVCSEICNDIVHKFIFLDSQSKSWDSYVACFPMTQIAHFAISLQAFAADLADWRWSSLASTCIRNATTWTLSLEAPNHGWKLWIKNCLFLAPLTVSRQGSDLNSVLPKNLPECTLTLIKYFHLLITLLILILIIKFCLLQSDQHLMTPLMMRKFLISYSPFSPIGNPQPMYLVTPFHTSPIWFEDVMYDVRKHVLIWIVGEIVVCKNKKIDMRWTQREASQSHREKASFCCLTKRPIFL